MGGERDDNIRLFMNADGIRAIVRWTVYKQILAAVFLRSFSVDCLHPATKPFLRLGNSRVYYIHVFAYSTGRLEYSTAYLPVFIETITADAHLLGLIMDSLRAAVRYW